MRKLGYHCTTGNAFKAVQRRMEELNIDIPSQWNNTTQQANIKNSMSIEEYFCKGSVRNGVGMRRKILKNHLLEYKCAICRNLGAWKNKSLILQIDHINGDNYDNRLENLRFHAQTETFAGENVKHQSKQIYTCSNCGAPISRQNKTHLCKSCAAIQQRKVERPNKEELIYFTKVGREHGVSETMVRKWVTSSFKGIRQYVKEKNLPL